MNENYYGGWVIAPYDIEGNGYDPYITTVKENLTLICNFLKRTGIEFAIYTLKEWQELED